MIIPVEVGRQGWTPSLSKAQSHSRTHAKIEDPRSIIISDDISADHLRETPNNTSAAVGIGGCGIIMDTGAAENGLRR